MRYQKLTPYEKYIHPSIHYTGSVRGMKNLGYWGKDDVCVRCGQYIYNLSITLPHLRAFRPKYALSCYK